MHLFSYKIYVEHSNQIDKMYKAIIRRVWAGGMAGRVKVVLIEISQNGKG